MGSVFVCKAGRASNCIFLICRLEGKKVVEETRGFKMRRVPRSDKGFEEEITDLDFALYEKDQMSIGK